MLAAALLAVGLAGPAVAEGSPVEGSETVDLRPEEKAEWTLRNVAAWFTLPFGTWNHWYREKTVLVETVPAEAELSLFYVRANFQKLSEPARSPVRVRLPNRIDSTPRDVFSVRAVAPGHESTLKSFRVHEIPERVVVRVETLPNALLELRHVHLAGRTTLWLRTREHPDLRFTRPEDDQRFTLALHRTAAELPLEPAIQTPLVSGVQVQQIGEDVLIQVSTRNRDVELRTKAELDPARREHLLVLDLLREGSNLPSVADIRREIEGVKFARDDPCAAAFEISLAGLLDPAEVTRAHRAHGTLVEVYQREAMAHLGRLSGGEVRTRTGERFRTGNPVEVALAMESPAMVEGYLALLGAIARASPDPAGLLHALVASERPGASFAEIFAQAEAARRACR
jgi:hypothetical protein